MYKYTIKKEIWHKVGKLKRNHVISLYSYTGDLVRKYGISPVYGSGTALWRVLESGSFTFYSGVSPANMGSIFIGGYPFKVTMFDYEEI